MADVASLIVRVGAQTRGLETAFARSTRKVQAFADVTESIGGRLSVVTAGVAALGAAVVSATAKFDALQKGLESQASSAEAAARQFQRLREIAKAPGIDLEQAVKGAIQLQAVGASAALAERTLRNVGRAVAASAGTPENFAGVNRQLQQIAGKGKILAQDLNIIKENAPAMAKALQAAFGATTAEEIENLNLSTEEFFNRLNDGIEKAIPRVEGGLGNALTNLRSSISQAFASLGAGQANELTKTIDRLATRIETLALAFSRLSPTTQRYTLYVIGLTASIGPLLLVLSALANAYRTIIAISLVSSIVGSTRAFLALIPAIRTAADAAYLFGIAARGVAAILLGPAGIALALTAIIGLFIKTKYEAAQALDAMRASIAGMSEATAQFELTKSVQEVARLNAELVNLQASVKISGAGRGTRIGGAVRERAKIAEIESRIATEIERQKAAAERLNVLRQPTGLGTDKNNFPGGAGAGDADEDRFKAEKKFVQLLRDAVALQELGLEPVRRAIGYQEELSRRAATAPFEDQITLLSLAADLAGAVSSRMQTAADAFKPSIDRAVEALSRSGEKGGSAQLNLSRIGEVQGAQLLVEATQQTAEYAARYPLLMKEGLRLTEDTADEAERIRQEFRRLADLSKLSNALAGILGQLGRMGERLADMVSQAGNLADALAAFKASQQETGQGGIFANLSNLTSALGIVSAGIGIVGSLLSGGNDQAEEARARRLDTNTRALEHLASQINRLANTAREAQAAQIAAGRLVANAGAIGAAGLLGRENAQIAYVNQLLADLGITFADLRRLAEEMGLELIRDNGTIAVDALDEFAEALGYHTEIITRLGTDVDAFRQLQEATNRIFNVTESPQQALNDALAEIRNFAGAGIAASFANVDLTTAEGRAAIQRQLQELFTRITSEAGLSLGDLGTFQNAQRFLQALLRADGALDQFADSAAKAMQNLNVPAGFKAALRRFEASQYENRVGPVSPPAAPPTGPVAPPQTPLTSPVPVAIQLVVSAGDDPEVIYGRWYDAMQSKSRSNPSLMAFVATLPTPSRRN